MERERTLPFEAVSRVGSDASCDANSRSTFLTRPVSSTESRITRAAVSCSAYGNNEEQRKRQSRPQMSGTDQTDELENLFRKE